MNKQKDGDWLLTMLKKGTQTDKISSLAMLVQKDPLSTHPYLVQLLSLSKKPNKKLAESAVTAFKDLYIQGHLTRELGKGLTKFNNFTRHPLVLTKREECSDDELVRVYHEHCIRELFREFVTSVLS